MRSRTSSFGCATVLALVAVVSPVFAQPTQATVGTAATAVPAAPPPAAPPTTAPNAELLPPAAAPAPVLAPPAPVPSPAAALPSMPPPQAADTASVDEDVNTRENLPLYRPVEGEAFVLPSRPPPPSPPPPPELIGELVAYSQVHSLFGGVVPNGSIGEVGIRYGNDVSQFIVGYVPVNELAVFGVSFSNLMGWKVAKFGDTATLSILAPSVELKAVTDFADVYFVPGATALGLAYVRCTGFPLSVKVRGPALGLWLPLVSNGQELPDTVPMLSVGAGVELGVVFF